MTTVANIVQVIGGGERGGSRAHLLALCRGLRERPEAPRVEIVCLTEGPVATGAREEGIPLTVLPMRGAADLRVIAKLRRTLRRAAPSIVHTHGVRANFVGRLAARGLPAALISTVHSSIYHDYSQPLKRRFYPAIERMTRGSVDRFIAVCACLRDELAGDGVPTERIAVIPNGLAPPRNGPAPPRSRLRQELGLKAGLPLLISVGRLEPVKGCDTLLDVLAALSGRVGFHAVVVGEGSQRRRLERRARELGLSRSVSFLGFRSDVASLMEQADLLVSTSRMEGSSLVLLEAMAAGLPVVVSRVGGMAEMVRTAGNGFAVPRGEISEYAAQIERLLHDPRLRRRLACQGTAALERHFSLRSFVDRTWAAYERAVQRPPTDPVRGELATP